MAQAKLIEPETPQPFKPVTIQVTFDTQKELNAMEAITGYLSFSFNAVKNLSDTNKTDIDSWQNVARAIYYQIKKFSK